MKTLVQTAFAEPDTDPGEDEPLVIHKRPGPPVNDALVVFVHGLGGTRYGTHATWGRFPAFIYNDVANVDVGMYSYRTLLGRLSLSRSVELDGEARVLADTIREAPYSKVVLVGHSMGGLLCKAGVCWLVETNQLPALRKVRGLVLMATPQLGSLRLPRVLWSLTADARALRPHGTVVSRINDIFINRINILEQGGPADSTALALPTWAVIASQDGWVDALSAGMNLPAAQQMTVRGSHTSIVKPQTSDKDEYEFVRKRIAGCIKEPLPAISPPSPANKPITSGQHFRVIAFDLDGTLIRGLEFSWTVVWNYLGFPEAVRKAGMLRYRRGQITYDAWCQWACEMFRSKGLTRKDFTRITAGLTVTKNLHQAISILKQDGFVTAILSGGIDVFLEELIPDAGKLFDHIHINRLKFDATGLISGVEVTPYDFEGKATALEQICKQHGYSIDQSIFVGEGFNDEYVAGRAGLTIAYPPTAQGFRTAAAVEIEADDLMAIFENTNIL